MKTNIEGMSPALQYEMSPALQYEKRTETVCTVPDGEYAVTVRNAHIQYQDVIRAQVPGAQPTTNVVLKDFNMTVKKGHIYGLLGASGCGKTSILRAIVGQLKLTAGEIRVLGHAPGTPESGIPGTTIGYMPQGLSLMEEFTIKELLYFYGKLAGMSSNEIDAKCDYFIKLLDLPMSNRIVETLSGGQQRRVSFAIALLHSPPVLVLDEPTVGVDPLLRESIWEHLTKVAKRDATVLITTHYIEEASQADTVGLMRHGKLMAEQSPRSLMETLQCYDLEEALVKLCIVQQSTKESMISSVNDAIPDLQKVKEDKIESTETSTWVKKEVSPIKRVRVMAWKSSVSLRRHYWFFVFIHLIPALCNFIFGSSFGRIPHGLKISVINQETNCSSSNSYKCKNRTDCENPDFLSCRILDTLQKGQIVSPVASESPSSAENDVRRGRSWAVMTFSKNFTSALMERARYSSPRDVKDDVIDTGSVTIKMDETDQVVSHVVKNQIYSTVKQVLADETTACNTFRHMKDLPMQFNTPIHGGQEASLTDSAMPGAVNSLVLMFPLTTTLSILLPDKIRGSLERVLVTGVTMGEVLLSYFVVCLIPVFDVIILLMIIPYVYFGFVMNGSFWTLAIILAPLAISGMLLGFILALLCDTFTAASLLGTGYYFTCFFASGSIWPVQGVFPYLREIFWILPMTFPTQAVRHVALKGWSLHHSSVQIGVISALIWCLIFLIILILILRINIRQ